MYVSWHINSLPSRLYLRIYFITNLTFTTYLPILLNVVTVAAAITDSESIQEVYTNENDELSRQYFFSFEQFSISHNKVVGGSCSKEPHKGA